MFIIGQSVCGSGQFYYFCLSPSSPLLNEMGQRDVIKLMLLKATFLIKTERKKRPNRIMGSNHKTSIPSP